MDGFSILYKKQTKLILKVVQTHTIQCTYNFLQYTEAVDTLVTEPGSGLLGLSNLGLDIWIKFRFQITGLRIGQSKINIYQFCTSVIKVKTTLDVVFLYRILHVKITDPSIIILILAWLLKKKSKRKLINFQGKYFLFIYTMYNEKFYFEYEKNFMRNIYYPE